MTPPPTTLLRWSLSVAIMTAVVAACSSGAPAATPEPTLSSTPAQERETPTPSAADAAPTDTPTIDAPSATAEAGADPTAVGSLLYVGNDGHVYVIRADGSGKVRISEPNSSGDRTAHTWPMWSGDGASVVFSQVVVGADGPRFSLQSATPGGAPSVVYESLPGAPFVGQNAPHYTNGSPDGQLVAFLAVAGNMTLFLNDVAGDTPARSVVQGSPLYYAWTDDSARLLIHLQDSLLLFQPDVADTLTLLDLPLSWDYRAPDWSPDGRRFAFVGDTEDAASLMVANADGTDPRTLAPASNTSAFAWSPDGSLIAFASTVTANVPVFDRVLLVEPENARSRVLTEAPTIAFFWSPGGERLALIGLSERSGHLIVTVFDIETGEGRQVAEFIPSSDMRVMLSFFDQYKESHRVWSADGRYLAFSGSLAGDGATPESHVLVIDASGDDPPLAVAAGGLAFWSPVAAPSVDVGGRVRLNIRP